MKSSMNKLFDAVIVAGGVSSRMGYDKLSAPLGEQTVLARTLAPFLTSPQINNVILVTDKEFDAPEGVLFAPAGKTRSLSVLSGLKKVTAPFVLIHDGARPFVTTALLQKLCEEVAVHRSAVPYLPATDTMRRRVGEGHELCDRSEYIFLQTPQAFDTQEIKRAYALTGQSETDDSTLYEKHVGPCHYVEGDFANKKITRPEDLFGSNALVGTGFDIHRLVEGRAMRLCGVTIPYPLGEEAHSDGDAPVHALMDAILTALSLPDIGHLFPDTDPAYKDIDSTLLLTKVVRLVREKNRQIISADVVILLEKPKVAPFLTQMRNTLAALIGISPVKLGISATTTEKVGLIGQNQAVAALAVVSIL